MRLNLKLAGLGLACFLILLISLFPARAGFALFAPDSVSGFGFSGTIWNGGAKVIDVGGQQLRNTEWDMALTRLLLGRLGGDIKTRWNNGFAEGFGTISLGGTIRLSEFKASIDAATLQTAVGTPSLGGQISLQIKELKLSNNWPRYLIGRAEIVNLSSPLMGRGEAALIGNFAVEFDSTLELEPGKSLSGKISDTGGPLELTGTLLLEAPANYTLKTRLKARPGAASSLEQNLEFLGTPEADGARLFQFAGSL
jgi:general secretion pathway protein N